MADNPYGKAKKGESASQRQARQKAFYTKQRKDLESKSEKGDVAAGNEVSKIYRKLGKSGKSLERAHLARSERGTGEDPEKVNKGILGGVASTFGLGGLGRFGKVAGVAGKAMRGIRAAKSIGKGAQDYQPTMARRALSGGGKSTQKALPGGKGPKMSDEKPMTMGGKKAPGSQNKPIYKRGGVAPRAGKTTGMGKMKPKSAGKMKKKAR